MEPEKGSRPEEGHLVDRRLRPAPTYCSFLRSRARTLINQTSSSRVLRIHAARSWVKSLCVCVASICFLCNLRPPPTDKGLRPHRCSWRQIPPDTSLATMKG